jgi:hypothetical protein
MTAPKLDKNAVNIAAGSKWRKVPTYFLIAFVALMAIAILGSDSSVPGARKFWTSYLNGWSFALVLGLGGLWFTIVQHLVRAGWSVVVRRVAENAAYTLPFTALLGFPILFGPSAHHESEQAVVEVPASDFGKPCEFENPEDPENSALVEGCPGKQVCDMWTHTCRRPVKGGIEDPCVGPKNACMPGLVCVEGDGGQVCAEPESVDSMLPGSHHIYEWTHREVVASDPILSWKLPYLNERAAKLRFGIYLLIWALLSLRFVGWSRKQDTAKPVEAEALAHKQRFWSAAGLLALVLSLTFGGFDFLMSLDPHWFSTMFGVYFFNNAVISTFALLTITLHLLHKSGYLQGVVTQEHFHDLGKFLFGFTVFWTYIAFSQYFLIWYANIPEETHWFAYRGHGDWLSLSIFLVLGRFIFPFFGLLQRGYKRNSSILVWFAVFMLGMSVVELFWLVQPAYAHHMAEYYRGYDQWESYEYYSHYITIGITDLMIPAFACLFGWLFTNSLVKHPLVPVNDPRLAESMAHENF